MDQLVSNPKTLKQRRENAKILADFNRGHSDDLFEAKKKGTKQLEANETAAGPSSGRKNANEIVNEFFNESDSENDLSIHSSRTPIGKYFNNRGRDTPMEDVEEEEPEEAEESSQRMK